MAKYPSFQRFGQDFPQNHSTPVDMLQQLAQRCDYAGSVAERTLKAREATTLTKSQLNATIIMSSEGLLESPGLRQATKTTGRYPITAGIPNRNQAMGARPTIKETKWHED
jgi:hypothetical protein